jgi:CRISPR-associated protein Cas1
LEGAAAAAYFQAFFQAFAPSLNVHQRKRRPPPDPVNAMLSLSYALLTSLAVQALWRTGLDPAIGFLHSLAHGRPALACDLIEPRRAEVDLWVQAQFRDRHLRAESFGHDGSGACLLGKAGRAHFYPAWDELARSLYRKMYQHSRHLTHYLTALNQPALAHRLDNDDFDPL